MDEEPGNELVKLLQIYEQRILDLESAVVQIADKLQSICDGVDGVVTETRRGNYSSYINNRSGDFEPYKEVYGSISNGRDIIADLVDNMLSNKVPDGDIETYVNNALGTMKDRFGKFVLPKEEPQAEMPESSVEIEVSTEPVEEEKKEDEGPKDPTSDLFSKMMSMRRKA